MLHVRCAFSTTTDLLEAFEKQYILVYSDLDQYLANEEISGALSYAYLSIVTRSHYRLSIDVRLRH